MRNKIKAIPTKYKEVIFRSKMESRFAMWCDDSKQEWVYEPEGLTDGNVMYLPDFYLPTSKMIVEIKPLFFIKETYKLDMLLNSEEFDNFGLAVIEMTPKLKVLRYAYTERYIKEDGRMVRSWSENKEIENVEFCYKCNAFNVIARHLHFSCNACGYYYTMR